MELWDPPPLPLKVGGILQLSRGSAGRGVLGRKIAEDAEDTLHEAGRAGERQLDLTHSRFQRWLAFQR